MQKTQKQLIAELAMLMATAENTSKEILSRTQDKNIVFKSAIMDIVRDVEKHTAALALMNDAVKCLDAEEAAAKQAAQQS